MSTIPFSKLNYVEEKQFHPVTEMFPMLGQQEYQTLKADILTNGQQIPIMLFEGQILDGRSRYQICLEYGIVPKYENIPTQDPLAYLVSININRRHLDQTQKAWIGAKIYNRKENGVQICTKDQVAKMMSIAPRSLASALATQKRGTTELHTAVQKGLLAVSVAEKISNFDPETQKRIVALGNKSKIKKAILEEKRRGDNGQTRDQDVTVAFSQEELVALQKAMRRHGIQTRDEFIRNFVLAACKENCLPPTYKEMKQEMRKMYGGRSFVKNSYRLKDLIVDPVRGTSKEERDMIKEEETFLESPFYSREDGALEAFVAARQGL